MTREEAEKFVINYIKENLYAESMKVQISFQYGFMKAYDNLKAKLREVPWTEEELKDQIQFLTGYVRASNGILNSGKVWEYGVEGGAKYLALWAEKRIRERGL